MGKTISIDEKIIRKVGFNPSGKGPINCRIGLPKSWFEQLGVVEDNPLVKVIFQDDKIIIEKEGD